MAEIPPSDPHQPPPSDGTPTPANFGQTGFSPYPRGVGGVDKAGLKSVALAQRRVLSAILANIGVTGLAYATQGAGSISPAMSIAVIALYICVVVFQVVAMVGLSNALGGSVGSAILVGISCFIPCVSLIVLLMLNGKATKALQASGIKVGVMGANLQEFD